MEKTELLKAIEDDCSTVTDEFRLKVEQRLPDTSDIFRHIAASKKALARRSVVTVMWRLKEEFAYQVLSRSVAY